MANKSTISFETNSTKACIIHTTLRNVLRQSFFGFTKSATCLGALNQGNSFLNEFLPAGLQSKIALCKSNLFLFGVTILSNQVTGIAGQHIIIDLSEPTLDDFYHFRDLTKMIRNLNAASFAGFHCTDNGFAKIFPALVTQQRHEFTSKPIFYFWPFARFLRRCAKKWQTIQPQAI